MLSRIVDLFYALLVILVGVLMDEADGEEALVDG